MENFDIKKIPKERLKKVLKEKNPVNAALFSFFITGGGQFYNGEYLKGIIFIILIFIFHGANLVQIFFVTLSIMDALNNAKEHNRKVKKFIEYLKNEENIILDL